MSLVGVWTRPPCHASFDRVDISNANSTSKYASSHAHTPIRCAIRCGTVTLGRLYLGLGRPGPGISALRTQKRFVRAHSQSLYSFEGFDQFAQLAQLRSIGAVVRPSYGGCGRRQQRRRPRQWQWQRYAAGALNERVHLRT